eukprot:TRINITY_DN6963_c0_g2_i1.p2 TRINITY_DN6963_c0_g2~~TRINITY_DN6963_c0_g2_i1.p2  ORF type:complete len:168 (-),score=26.40 TRINITY_DN6963_c0_g2_i1:180-683(-)
MMQSQLSRGSLYRGNLSFKNHNSYKRVTRGIKFLVKSQEESQEKSNLKTDLKDEEDQQVLAIEDMIRKNRGKKAKSEKIKVVSPVVEQVYGNKEPTEAQKNETYAVTVLFTLAGVILLEGLFLALSGFFPEEVDQFAQNIIYPIFSPTVVLLLAGSTAYGLWKSRQQ